MRHDLIGQCPVARFAQSRRVLFTHQGKIGESPPEQVGHHGLGAEIGHGHRRLILLVHRSCGHEIGLNCATEKAGLLHRLNGDPALFGIRHARVISRTA